MHVLQTTRAKLAATGQNYETYMQDVFMHTLDSFCTWGSGRAVDVTKHQMQQAQQQMQVVHEFADSCKTDFQLA